MRGRVVLLLVLVIVVVAVAVGAMMLSGGGDNTDTTVTPGTGEPDAVQNTPAPGETIAATRPVVDEEIPVAAVVIALQDLPRGMLLSDDHIRRALENDPSAAIAIDYWPVEAIPETGFGSLEEMLGQNYLLRTDIPRESPILRAQLAQVSQTTQSLTLGRTGSDAALLIDAGDVGITIPFDITGVGSVAYAPQQGDYVDVLMSFLFIEVDEEFQTRQPNQISVITRSEEGELIFTEPLEGRTEPSPLSALGAVIVPTEIQRPRLVTQRTVRGAKVIYVGYFPPEGQILGLRTATPTPFDTPTLVAGATQQSAPPTPIPTATPYIPLVITLGVDQQDALVLAWALDSQIPIQLTLRSAYDTNPRDPNPATTAVTLQWLIEQYEVAQPSTLPYALEPAIRELRSSWQDLFNEFAVPDAGTEPPPQ